MASLREVQTAFAQAVVLGRSAAAEAEVRPGHLPSWARLRIYRNSILEGAVAALASAYPIVKRLVGEVCFRAVAHRYAEEVPSLSGDLEVYGDRFACFLQAPSHAWGLPYLPDTAHLEWACHEVLRASMPPIPDFAALARLAQEQGGRLAFRLSAAVRLVASDYPILRIWEANQEDEVGPLVNLNEGSDRLIVTRLGPRPAIRRVSAGEFALLEAVERRETVEAGCHAAMKVQADLDIVAVVRDSVLSGFFAF